MKASSAAIAAVGSVIAFGSPATPNWRFNTRQEHSVSAPTVITFATTEHAAAPRNGLPSLIAPDQVYFWSEAWQRGEHETDEDIAAGRVHGFADIDDALIWLMSSD